MTTKTEFTVDRTANHTYEVFNGLSHLLMGPIAFVLTIIMAITADRQHDFIKVISVSIYGFTMTCVFLASVIYHLIPSGPKLKHILRRIDQGSIFPYIAATSTVLNLVPLIESNGIMLTVLIWTFCIAGIIFKAMDYNLPFVLECLIYILLASLLFVDADVLLLQLNSPALWALALGGACYIIGAVIVALEEYFDDHGIRNFHEIWHVLVILGSLFHWYVIQFHIIYFR